MMETLFRLGGTARRELLIVNACIIPSERFVEGLRDLRRAGVRTRILTNSLASHDVPAVNSHYKSWRRPLREVTDGLFEMRHDASIPVPGRGYATHRSKSWACTPRAWWWIASASTSAR